MIKPTLYQIDRQPELFVAIAKIANSDESLRSIGTDFSPHAAVRDVAQAKKVAVFNFEVEQTHTYIAGGIRVHNDSVLDFLSDGEMLERVIRDDSGRPISYIAKVDGGQGTVTVTATEIEDSNTTEVTKEYIYSRDSKQIELMQVDEYRINEETGENEIATSRVVEVNLDGQRYGESLGHKLSPFLTQAFIGKNTGALEKISVDSITKTLLGNLGEFGGAVINHSLLEADTNPSVIAQLAVKTFEDLPGEFLLNTEGAAIKALTSFIAAEIFEDPFYDELGGVVFESVTEDLIQSGLTNAAYELTRKTLISLDASDELTGLFSSKQPSFLKNPIGFVMTKIVEDFLPDIKTLEGQIGAAVVGWALKILPFTKVLGPFSLIVDSVIGWAVGKFIDLFSSPDPYRYIVNTKFDSEAEAFKITFINDRGEIINGEEAADRVKYSELIRLTSLQDDREDDGLNNIRDAFNGIASSYVNFMNKIVQTVDANEHNLAAESQWFGQKVFFKSFGYDEGDIKFSTYDEQLEIIWTYDYQDTQTLFLEAAFDSLQKMEFQDGNLVVARALEAFEEIDFSEVKANSHWNFFELFLTDVANFRGGDYDMAWQLYQGASDENPFKLVARRTFEEDLYGWDSSGFKDFFTFAETQSFWSKYKKIFEALENEILDGYRFWTKGPDPDKEWKERSIDLVRPFYDGEIGLDVPKALWRLKKVETVSEAIELLGNGPTVYTPSELIQDLNFRIQIADEYVSYLKNPEPQNAILEVAPGSADAAGILTTLMLADQLGLNDPYSATGSEINNRFLTADGDDVINGGAGDDLIEAAGGHDMVEGGRGRDAIYGGTGNDLLFGDNIDDVEGSVGYGGFAPTISPQPFDFFGFDDDVIEGGGGNDEIDGGVGVNTAVFSGNISDYVIRASSLGQWNVIDARPDQRDGSDTLVNIDVLRFRDAEVTIGNEASEWITPRYDWEYPGARHYLLGGEGSDSFFMDLSDKVGRVSFEILDFEMHDQIVFPSNWRHEDDPSADRNVGTYGFRRDGDYFVVSWTGWANYGTLSFRADENPFERVRAADQSLDAIGRFLPPGPLQEWRESYHAMLQSEYVQHIIGRETETLALIDFLDAVPDVMAVDKYQIWYDVADITINDDGLELERGVGQKVTDIAQVSITVPDLASESKFYIRLGNDQDWSIWQSITVTAEGPKYRGALQGTELADVITGGDGEDYIVGYGGSDTLSGHYYDDHLFGHGGDDLLYGGQGNDVLEGGDGNDRLFGQGGDDRLYGGRGDDRLGGSLGSDLLRGGDGDDHVDGSDGDDRLYGNHGIDYLLGGNGSDYAYGGDGDDVVRGEAGDDRLFGGNGNDRLLGEAGNDRLEGGSGDDSIDGGLDEGDDWANGGNGNDYILGRQGRDRLLGGNGNDKIWGGIGNDYVSGGSGDDYVDGGAGIDQVFGDLGNDTVRGREGDDWLQGGDGDDVVVGDEGNDRLNGNGGHDRLYGNDGNDTIYGSTGDDHLNGGAGNDQLSGGIGDDTVSGWDGDDVLNGDAGADWLVGHDGDDVIYGGDDDDTLRGHDGQDQLFGGRGNDAIAGFTGHDWISGGAGADKMWGGTGADTFVFNSGDGDDVVYDFSLSEDQISFQYYKGDSNPIEFVDTVGGVTIHHGLNDSIILQGVGANELTEESYRFLELI